MDTLITLSLNEKGIINKNIKSIHVKNQIRSLGYEFRE